MRKIVKSHNLSESEPNNKNNLNAKLNDTSFKHYITLWFYQHDVVTLKVCEVKWKSSFMYRFQACLAGQLRINIHWCKIKCCWVWHRLIGALTHQLPPSCGRQRVGVAASLQTGQRLEGGLNPPHHHPSLLRHSLCLLCVASWQPLQQHNGR